VIKVGFGSFLGLVISHSSKGVVCHMQYSTVGAQGEPLVSVAGSPSNTNLPIFAVGASLADRDAVKRAGKFPVLHLGFDTIEWNYKLDDLRLAGLVCPLAPMVGAGEQVDSQYSFVVTRVGGFSYRYKVQFSCGFDVYLPDLGFSRYGLRVVAHSKACVLADDIEADVLAVLGYLLGLDVEGMAPLVLSRVDVCLDVLMPDADFQRFSGQVAGRSSSVVTRARHMSGWIDSGRYTGVSIGKEQVKLRAYDKGAEALVGGDWPFWSQLYGRGESFEVPVGQVVARFEFQLRREALRDWNKEQLPDGLDTLEHFRNASGDVLHYLCTDWFRLAGAARGHEHERRSLPFWRGIRDGFVSSAWSSYSGVLRRKLKRSVSSNLGKLTDMAAGCLASMAAVLGHTQEDERSSAEDDRPSPSAVSDTAALGFLRQHIDHVRAKWEAGRDRRFKQLKYPAKNVPVEPTYRDIWTGQAMPI
jgi:hypothetical protein